MLVPEIKLSILIQQLIKQSRQALKKRFANLFSRGYYHCTLSSTV